jgi:hypothetical protein
MGRCTAAMGAACWYVYGVCRGIDQGHSSDGDVLSQLGLRLLVHFWVFLAVVSLCRNTATLGLVGEPSASSTIHRIELMMPRFATYLQREHDDEMPNLDREVHELQNTTPVYLV